jgi:hypothetical protein
MTKAEATNLPGETREALTMVNARQLPVQR